MNTFVIRFWEYLATKCTIIYTHKNCPKMRKMLTSFQKQSRKISFLHEAATVSDKKGYSSFKFFELNWKMAGLSTGFL